MDTNQAIELIADAIPGAGGTWADVGAGHGTFTRALARVLGPTGRIYAVDRDPRAFASLRRLSPRERTAIVPVLADFTQSFALPGLDEAPLDGLLVANALHFVPDAEGVLARLVALIRPGGRVVLVEYDRRAANRWVPYPIPIARLPDLARSVGLSPPTITATRPSAFGGTLYAAVADIAGVRPSRPP
jgi:ubiquinone/menaquinone biosynthesis C-methylase UbiE